jgi:hypothetical protein
LDLENSENEESDESPKNTPSKSSYSKLFPNIMLTIFKAPTTAILPPPRTPFRTLKDIENVFSPTQQPTIDPKTPGNRKFKAATRKLQSSPIKGADDGNVSDGYTTVTGNNSKRIAKKVHVASLGKVKLTRFNNSSRYEALARKVEEVVEESRTVTKANPEGTRSGPESNGESSSEVSSSSNKESSSAESSRPSGVATTTPQTRSSNKRH